MEKIVLYVITLVLAFFALNTVIIVAAPFIAIGLLIWLILLLFSGSDD